MQGYTWSRFIDSSSLNKLSVWGIIILIHIPLLVSWAILQYSILPKEYQLASALITIIGLIPFTILHELLHWIVLQLSGIKTKFVLARHKKMVYGVGVLIKNDQLIKRNTMIATLLMPQILTAIFLIIIIMKSITYGFISGYEYISFWYGMLIASLAGSSLDILSLIDTLKLKRDDLLEGVGGGTIIWEKKQDGVTEC